MRKTKLTAQAIINRLKNKTFFIKRDRNNEMMICGKRPKIVRSEWDGQFVKIVSLDLDNELCAITDVKGKGYSARHNLSDLREV
jgi:hypothetical protein